ncbi:MAG TPA: hypothetical protein VNZ49_01480 [Bacteroidia bacterium]|jgi:hypothetical protein|nr:hypothetical protein [Bacteroidia bacterium]
MKKKNTNKRTLFILIPLLGLSLLAFILLPRTGRNIDLSNEESAQAVQSAYDVDDQKHEAPVNHEPVFVSVFKFIVNCNPFKREAQL